MNEAGGEANSQENAGGGEVSEVGGEAKSQEDDSGGGGMSEAGVEADSQEEKPIAGRRCKKRRRSQ